MGPVLDSGFAYITQPMTLLNGQQYIVVHEAEVFNESNVEETKEKCKFVGQLLLWMFPKHVFSPAILTNFRVSR